MNGPSDYPLPSNNKPEGPYPTNITQSGTNKIVPVVQAMAFTKYLGYMNLTFDENGDLTEFEGRPILLDHTMPQGN